MREMYCICTSKVPKIGTIPVSFGYISIGDTKKYMKCTVIIAKQKYRTYKKYQKEEGCDNK